MVTEAGGNNDRLTIEHTRAVKGRVKLKVVCPDGNKTYVDTIAIGEAASREGFVDAVCGDFPGVDRESVMTELDIIADKNTQPRQSQADLLVELACEADMFHGPGGDDSFATVRIGGHHETMPIYSKGFRRYLCRRFWEEYHKAPCSQNVQDALTTIAGQAVFAGPERKTCVRLAEHDGAIYLDFGNDNWQAVRIDRSGWQVVNNSPVRFLRKSGMLPLPIPTTGGSVDDLRQFVNLPDDDDWCLFLAWIVAALRPTGPYPVLCVTGEQGSAKSTLCRVARALVDPNAAPLRRPAKDDRDLMIAARNGWIISFDNVSRIPPSLSDSLCCLATGGGLATRELYSDDGEVIFDAMRPVLLNGIPSDLTCRSDLADRAIVLNLPTIADNARRKEADFWRAFNDARPRIFGALLDGVAVGLERIDSVKLDRLPRMADFAAWSVASESAVGLPAGTFLQAYAENRAAGRDRSIESEPIGPAVERLLDVRGSWCGTAAELLEALSGSAFSEETTRKSRGWPKSARALAERLRRLAPDLRGIGIVWRPPIRAGRGSRRTHSLEKVGILATPPTAPTAAAESPPHGTENADSGGRSSVGAVASVEDRGDNRPHENRPGATVKAVAVGGDGAVGPIPAESNGGEVCEWTF